MILLLACNPEVIATQVMASNPLSDMERLPDAPETRVVVKERVDAGSYMYLDTELGWIASLDKPVAVGDEVTVRPIGLARDFHSARTGRSFAELRFSVVRPD